MNLILKSLLIFKMQISRYYRHYLEQRRNRLSPTNLKKIPTKKFKKGKLMLLR